MMPDDIAAQACHDGERVHAQAMHGYQSAWMAHWMHTSYKSATPACNHVTMDCELKEVKEDTGADQKSKSMHAGAFGEEARATRVNFSNEADTGRSKKASSDPNSFPVFDLSRKLDGRLSLQREENSVYHGEDLKSETEACSGDDTVSLNRAGNHLPSTSAHAPPKSCKLLSEGTLAVPTSLWNDFEKSASDIVPNGRDKGKTLMPQFKRLPLEIYQSSYNAASQECFASTKYHSYSSLLIREKKISSLLLDPQRSSFSRWMQGGIAHLPHDPVAGSDGLYFVRGQDHKIQNYTANPNITNHTASSESIEPQNFYGVSSLVKPVPCSVHDVETKKIYTCIDSVEESPRGHPKISETTQQYLMSRKSDVNLSDRGQFFEGSIVPKKFKGNAEILDFSPPMSDCALDGLKLEALGSSIKSEGKENAQDFKSPTSLKNESSAETDTMDINALHENHLFGNVSLQTNKAMFRIQKNKNKKYSKDSQNSLTSQVGKTSARERTIAKSVNTAVPDINQEPHELLTPESPVVDRENSTSRTHSLNVEHLSIADEQARSKSGNSSLGSDPDSRWVKRLKLCALGSARGTRSAKIGESSSHEKVNNIFSKIMKGNTTSLEPKIVYHAEGEMVPDLPATVLTNGKSSFTEAKKTVEITLSHPWIQRWSHNRAASSHKRHELVELREPKSSNTLLLEEFQKKQFPSVAAMALMGKALNNINPSELMKKGPITKRF